MIVACLCDVEHVADREGCMRGRGGAASWRAVPVLLATLPLVAVSVISTASPASASRASAATPVVGECYDLPAEVLLTRAGWLEPVPVPVPCTASHTFEVTRVGALPDLPETEDPTDLAAQQCGPLGVWNEVGVNRPTAGVVTDPLRIEARSFAVREPTPVFVCGAVAVEWSRRGELGIVPLTAAIEDLTAEQLEELRYCSRARGVRRPWTAPVTVSCSSQPRWEATAWVLWTAFYDEDPGRARLRARAVAICGDEARFSLPRAVDWSTGLPWTRCYERRR